MLDKIAKMFFEGLSRVLLVLLTALTIATVLAQIVIYLTR
jgi:hypothetical protein